MRAIASTKAGLPWPNVARALRLTAPLLLAGLAGCAAISYAKDNYAGITPQYFTAANGDKYTIYDNIGQSRLMIGPGATASATQGFVKGLGLGSIPPVVFRDVAEQYLRSTERRCTAQDVTLILDPRYEVRYRCERMRGPSDVLLGPA
ncbi:hypothetical protein [Phyllobacterium endophyticum]|uniref:Lipoprotein n=1 Tax=Phyllobacterium endophyticum TaxID=1149773 RepID=A0A2P7AUH5_9HYPH|nr:hypothetical protein [Phyllobacterium endophyticum]MBB3234321.1 hypothetical protein [Phyllobacterium endophyticum]PSH57851.1 hypothetical protein CU100_09130 [Phyllobacterium endophyticum]TYR44058.1 hypothetical protein FY050_02485 [Phyllobacterium endophyticum]